MIEVPSDPELLVLVGEFPFYSPEDLFDAFTDPQRVVEWWPKEAIVEPVLGGRFVFRWPDQDWTLKGAYTAFIRGKHLGFTWKWNHGPEDSSPLQVDVYFAPLEEGARMSIFHGRFVDRDAPDRDGIREGWIHFGMILAGLRREDSRDNG